MAERNPGSFGDFVVGTGRSWWGLVASIATAASLVLFALSERRWAGWLLAAALALLLISSFLYHRRWVHDHSTSDVPPTPQQLPLVYAPGSNFYLDRPVEHQPTTTDSTVIYVIQQDPKLPFWPPPYQPPPSKPDEGQP